MDPEPVLRIGVLEGDEPYQFSGLAGAVRLRDGTVVAADGASNEVRYFDASGRFLAATGGGGEGPGEFASLTSLGPAPGDRVWAYDFGTRRVTWLDGDGRVVRTATLDPEPPALQPIGQFPDGSFLLKQLWGVGRTAAASGEGPRRDPVAFVRFDTAGSLVDTLAMVPGRELYLREEGGRGVMVTPLVGRNAVGAIRPEPDGSVEGAGEAAPGAAWRATVVLGDQTDFELREHAPDGTLLRILRIPNRDLTLTPAEHAEILEEYVASAPPERRSGLRASMEAQPVPERLPAYGPVASDPRGNLWLGEWARGPSGHWTVLGADGGWLGDVTLPEGLIVHQVGADWILGVETDEVDVEYVVLYNLRK